MKGMDGETFMEMGEARDEKVAERGLHTAAPDTAAAKPVTTGATKAIVLEVLVGEEGGRRSKDELLATEVVKELWMRKAV